MLLVASAVTSAAIGHHDCLLQELPLGSEKIDYPSRVSKRLLKLAVLPEILPVPVFCGS
jgi:hypothetical protein